MPRWGCSRGNCSPPRSAPWLSRAKRSKLGVATGSPFHPTSAANSGSLRTPASESCVLVRKYVDHVERPASDCPQAVRARPANGIAILIFNIVSYFISIGFTSRVAPSRHVSQSVVLPAGSIRHPGVSPSGRQRPRITTFSCDSSRGIVDPRGRRPLSRLPWA